MTNISLILASSSPRRHELLSRLGIPFEIITADIDESISDNETPKQYINRMVEKKADSILHSICCLPSTNINSIKTNKDLNTSQPDKNIKLILTCDTIGVMPNGTDILIKPIDKDDAFQMWQKMSGTCHYVWTAVQATLVSFSVDKNRTNDNNQLYDAEVLWQKKIIEETKVQFIEITSIEMQQYWETDEPADKAGAYAIQGRAAAWVDKIDGSYTNVVGLPLAQTKQLIQQAITYA